MNKLQEDVSPLTRTPGLDSELDRLQELLDRLTVDYRAARNSSTPDTGGVTPDPQSVVVVGHTSALRFKLHTRSCSPGGLT